MMKEEFESLTSVTVSTNYYHRLIESQYVEQNVDKKEFCDSWLKLNKNKLTKAVTSDIDQLSLNDVTKDAIIEQLKRENQKLSNRENKLEAENYNLTNKCKELTSENEALNSTSEALNKTEAQLKETTAQLNATLDELSRFEFTSESILAQKDLEIIRLKAKLFDLMNAQ